MGLTAIRSRYPLLNRVCGYRFLKFGAVGVSGTLVNTCFLYLGQEYLFRAIQPFQMRLNASLGLAIFCATVNNFVWNRNWTWADRNSNREQPLILFGQYVLACWLGTLLQVVFTKILAAFHIYYIVANIIAIVLASIINFIVNDKWTFARVKLPSRGAAGFEKSCQMEERLTNEKKPLYYRVDKILILSILLGFAFSIHGINWGRVECWNPDQMALLPLKYNKGLPLYPSNFLKPPFHTYFNFLLSQVPIRGIGKVFSLSPEILDPTILLWSRTLTVFLFLGSIILVFSISKGFFGSNSARLATIFFSTSAGFIAFNHFLTADIPLIFWMLLAFYFDQKIILRGKTIDYVLAGFLTGIATATKYNGLSVGIAIVVAHALSLESFTLRRFAFDKKLILGLSMVVIGFLVGNPHALLAFPKFYSDFMYNYATTPVYTGIVEGNSYWKFLYLIIEVVGIPTFFIIAISFVISIYLIIKHGLKSCEQKNIILLLAVFLLYYWKLGSFPRLETRFVLPIVPFLLILSCVLFDKVKLNKVFLSIILVTILIYNLASCYYVGKRFRDDPRMDAQIWVENKIINGSSIESTSYVPRWNKIKGVELNDMRFPDISGRKSLFEGIFINNKNILEKIQRFENDDQKMRWYTLSELNKRNPDYIAINSLYYSRFFITDKQKYYQYYPEIKNYFKELLEEKFPYEIVYDRKSPGIPDWIYPKHIDFLENRMTILWKKSPVIGGSVPLP